MSRLAGSCRGYVDAVLIQQRLIAGVREACHADERLDAGLMYGSFASGAAATPAGGGEPTERPIDER